MLPPSRCFIHFAGDPSSAHQPVSYTSDLGGVDSKTLYLTGLQAVSELDFVAHCIALECVW